MLNQQHRSLIEQLINRWTRRNRFYCLVSKFKSIEQVSFGVCYLLRLNQFLMNCSAAIGLWAAVLAAGFLSETLPATFPWQAVSLPKSVQANWKYVFIESPEMTDFSFFLFNVVWWLMLSFHSRINKAQSVKLSLCEPYSVKHRRSLWLSAIVPLHFLASKETIKDRAWRSMFMLIKMFCKDL